MRYNTRLPAATVLGGAFYRPRLIHCERAAHGQKDTILMHGPASRVKDWEKEGRRVGGGGEMGSRSKGGMDPPNPLGQECPLDAAGDQCSFSLLSNLSLFRRINVLVSLGSCKPPHQ